MRNLFSVFIFSSFFSLFENVKIKFDPNQLRLTSKPERITKLLESLLKTDNLDLLKRILRTEASDFIIPYCNAWKTKENSDLIHRIWNNYYMRSMDKEMLKELILPECVAKSYYTLLGLSIQMIQSFPHSLLQVKDFPFQFLLSPVLEHVLKKAIYSKPQDPKVKWSSWIVRDERDFLECPDSLIYFQYGWQQISPQEFQKISVSKSDCLIKWLVLESDSDLIKLSEEEALIRSLTLISWKSTTALHSSIIRKINQRDSLESDCFKLIKEIIILSDSDWNLNLLFRVMTFLKPEIILIGDWFIGILSLWQNALKLLKRFEKEHLRILDNILQFALFTLQPTFQGVTKLPELFDPSLRSFIEKQVYERFRNEIKLFYREFPYFFQYNFSLIPLNIRLSSFLRKKRVFSSNNGPFLLNNDYDMETFKRMGPKDFLLFIGDKLRNGIDDLSRTSLNPALYSYAGKLLSFKGLTKLFFLSIAEMPKWFQIKKMNGKNYVIPMPICPDLFWELLGYFLIQARVLHIKTDIVLEKEFFLAMMSPKTSKLYIKSLSESFNERSVSETMVLSSNMNNRFTLASIMGTKYDSFDEECIDCESLAFRLFRKGMKFMQQGINHVLESTKLTSEELYNFMFIS